MLGSLRKLLSSSPRAGLLLTDVDTYFAAGGVYDGTWGFNALLCAMCLGGLFFVVNWYAALAAVLCSFLSAVVLSVLLAPFAQVGFPKALPFKSRKACLTRQCSCASCTNAMTLRRVALKNLDDACPD
jgi:hypothetical protein